MVSLLQRFMHSDVCNEEDPPCSWAYDSEVCLIEWHPIIAHKECVLVCNNGIWLWHTWTSSTRTANPDSQSRFDPDWYCQCERLFLVALGIYGMLTRSFWLFQSNWRDILWDINEQYSIIQLSQFQIGPGPVSDWTYPSLRLDLSQFQIGPVPVSDWTYPNLRLDLCTWNIGYGSY